MITYSPTTCFYFANTFHCAPCHPIFPFVHITILYCNLKSMPIISFFNVNGVCCLTMSSSLSFIVTFILLTLLDYTSSQCCSFSFSLKASTYLIHMLLLNGHIRYMFNKCFTSYVATILQINNIFIFS